MIFIAIPNMRWICTPLARTRTYWEKNYPVRVFDPEMLKPIGYARNVCVDKFLKTQATHFFLVDADVAPPEDTLEKLLKADVDVIAARVNVMKLDGDGTIKPIHILCRRNKENDLKVYFGQGVERVDRAGFACVLFKRSVFEQIACPWFESKDWGAVRGTDFGFCEKLEKVGIPVHGHFDTNCQQLIETYI